MDTYYKKHLVHCDFERIANLKQQLQGIDLILNDKRSGTSYFVDEKAQLDYINECLPTFAFELAYQKNNVHKKGWLFDTHKKTQFYALITNIFSDEKDVFTSCNITFVNRENLIFHLDKLGLNRKFLEETAKIHKNLHGKFVLKELDPKNEGYLYFSTRNKVEKPINLILKLDYLMKIGVAKRLV